MAKKKEYGSELRRIREEERYKLGHVADFLEVSSAYLSEVEKGKKGPLSDYQTGLYLSCVNRISEYEFLRTLAAQKKGKVVIDMQKNTSRSNVAALIMLKDLIENKVMTDRDWSSLKKAIGYYG